MVQDIEVLEAARRKGGVIMRFPLTEDMFNCQEYAGNDGYKKFIRAIVCAINSIYEAGKRVAHSGLYFETGLLKAWQEKVYGRKAESEADTVFFEALEMYANDAWQQGVRDSGKVFDVSVDKIKIFPCFEEHLPKAEKMEQKRQYFRETGLLRSQIILDSGNNLIDGYTSYLLAKENNIECVPIRYGKRQIVRAYHKQGDKLYAWELPGLLIDRVSVGDKLIVPTRRGVRVATVAAVEEYRPEDHQEPLRIVIRKKKKVREA